MRKRLITPSPQDAAAHHEGWLDLDRLAVVRSARASLKSLRLS